MCHSSCVRVNGYASESIEALTQWHYASECIEALTEWQYIHMCGMTHESIHWIAYSMTLRPPYSFITQHLFVFQNFLKNILELTLWCDITHLYELWLRSSYLCTHAHVLAYEWVIRLPLLLLFSYMCVHKYELLSHRTHAYDKTYVCNRINCWVTWLLRDKTPFNEASHSWQASSHVYSFISERQDSFQLTSLEASHSWQVSSHLHSFMTFERQDSFQLASLEWLQRCWLSLKSHVTQHFLSISISGGISFVTRLLTHLRIHIKVHTNDS